MRIDFTCTQPESAGEFVRRNSRREEFERYPFRRCDLKHEVPPLYTSNERPLNRRSQLFIWEEGQTQSVSLPFAAVSTQAVQHEIEHIEIAELPAEGDVGVLINQGARKHEIDAAIREPAVRTETHATEFG